MQWRRVFCLVTAVHSAALFAALCVEDAIDVVSRKVRMAKGTDRGMYDVP
jgi:hypothetical protein